MAARFLIALALMLLPGAALADCPAAPDIKSEMDRLIERVQAAPDARSARSISGEMWKQWLRAPDARAQELLDEGMQRRESYDLAGALTAFDALVAYCPDYAEGYNQRAFANFIRGDHAAALPDLDRAIGLSPRHVAAIAGRGLTLISMGRVSDGQDVIREALELNPWLAERQFLDIPVPPGEGVEL